MADLRRLVSKDEATGTVTVIRDYENGSTFQSVENSWVVTPGQRKPTMADSQHRYGGSRQTGESTANGEIAWTILVRGATSDAALANAELLFGDLESLAVLRNDLFIAWKPDGASNTTYYEVRGPGTYQPHYSWREFVGTGVIPIDIKIPVGPLAHLTAYDITITSTTLPATIALASPITGNAPAMASVSLTTSGGTDAPIWALVGWTKRPGTPLASSVAPFGLIQAETGTTLSGWAAVSNAGYYGSSALEVVTSGAGTASALFATDPSIMQADEFTAGEVQVEVWARVLLQNTLVSPRFTLSVQPSAGTAFGAAQYSAEFGSVGRLLTLPSATTIFRFVKLGTLNLPVDPAQPLKHNVKVAAAWAAGSSGALSLDYLVLVPARQRAVSPSGKPNDDAYPPFIASTAQTTKTIRSDLSGRVAVGAAGAANPGRDSGLGGQLLELPVGNVDLLLKLSSLVADDPTVDATSERISHSGVVGSMRVTPRVWLAG